MKRKRHTPEQIIHKLRQADAELAAGQPIAAICQKLQISEQTFHRWRNQFGGLKADDARRLKELERENARLRKAVANLTLDKVILKETLSGKYCPDAATLVAPPPILAWDSAPGLRLLPLHGKRKAGLTIEPDSHTDWYIDRGQVNLAS